MAVGAKAGRAVPLVQYRRVAFLVLPAAALLLLGCFVAVMRSWRQEHKRVRFNAYYKPNDLGSGTSLLWQVNKALEDGVFSLRTRRCIQQYRDVLMKDYDNKLERAQHNLAAQKAMQEDLEAYLKETNPGLQFFKTRRGRSKGEIVEGHSGWFPQKQALYWAIVSGVECVQHVCEIGFNAGHSATVWLAARPDTVVHAFDLGVHNYTRDAIDFFRKRMPGRLNIVLGDSRDTVPVAVRRGLLQCDLVIVDGGHTYPDASNDIRNIVKLARPPGGFTGFLIDDVMCPHWFCEGPDRALQEAEQAGLVTILRRLSEVSYVGGKSLSLAHKQTSNPMTSGVAVGYVTSTLAVAKQEQ